MSTSKNKRAITVGVFITLALAILIVAVFTLGGQQKTFVKSINLTAVFDDVAGLQKGNNIWFSGVKIGTVKDIVFYGGSQVKVTLHIEEKAKQFIRRDAKAKISSDGLIGNKIIVIYGGTTTAGEVQKDDQLAVEKSTGTDDLMATLQVNNLNLADITSDFKIISKRLAEGQGTLGSLLADTILYKNLQITLLNLQHAAKNSQQLTAGIADYTNKLQSPGSLAAGLVQDTMIMSNLQSAVMQLNKAATSANNFAADLKSTSEDLNNNNNAVGVLLRDEQAAAELRTIIKNLSTGSATLNEDLEAIQHNFLFRGYFRKKAKQEKKENN